MINTLQDFLAQSAVRNSWIKFEKDNLSIYVRQGPRIIDRKKYFCLDIANIEAKEPGNKAWKRFLTQLEGILSITKHEMIFIENVLNERFATSLVKNYGFTNVLIFEELGIPCFYKKVIK